MPDVIVNGMEMPKGCYSCPIGNHIGLYAVQCPITKSKIDGVTECIRLSDCPLHPAPEWISMEERLPEAKDWYLTFNEASPSGFSNIDKWMSGRGRWLVSGSNRGHVTHWMPLPEPPKEEETT